MTSIGDPTGIPEDPDEWTFVPQGPAWDAWNAPDGGAVKLVITAMKMRARWLRRAKPRPFGFAPGSAHPVPVHLGQAHGAGTLSSGAASLLGVRTPVHTMSLSYGDTADPHAAVALIISDFHRDYQNRDLKDALAETAAGWAGQARALGTPSAGPQATGSRPEITTAQIDVVLSGRRRPIALHRLGDCCGFQAGEDGVLVSVLARHMAPGIPDIVRLHSADLEPLLASMENPDKDLVAEAVAEQRRRDLERVRNQAGHPS